MAAIREKEEQLKELKLKHKEEVRQIHMIIIQVH